MLCTLNITDSKLYIKFLNMDQSLIERKVPFDIIWGESLLVKIPPEKNIVGNTRYCFPLKKEIPFKTPTIIIKYQVRDYCVYLAPAVSILLDPISVSGKTVKSKKGKMIVLNQLAENLCSKGLLVTVIHPEDVGSNEQEVISGYIYTSILDEYNWRKATFPFPKVIYNQISARKWEALEISENAKTIIVNKIGERFFNSCFLDKFESYSILSKNPDLKKYLLDAKMYTCNNLIAMLEKHKLLYIKPISNSLGIGIWRALKLKDGKYMFQVKKNNKVVNYSSKNLGKLVRFFDASIGNRAYLIQQGVDLLKYEERIFDARVLTQKSNDGKWSFTGAGARVAAPKAFMTHVPNGGEIMNLEWILEKMVNDKDKLNHIQEQLQFLTTYIPKTLEDELAMHFGEISMDIGINKDFELFLIEINAKPMKFDEVDIQQKAIEKLAGYISYLSDWDEMPD